MLLELDIETGSITFQEEYKENIILRFGIYGKKNFENFYKHVGLSHSEKAKSISSLLESYQDIGFTKRRVLETVLNAKAPINTLEVAKINKINRKLALFHLLDLAKQGKVAKTSRCSPALWRDPSKNLINKREKILNILSKDKLSTLDISERTNIDQKYVFDILNNLKNQGLIICSGSRPRKWEAK